MKNSRVATLMDPAARQTNRQRKPAQQPEQSGRGSNRLVSAARSFAAKILAFELTNQAAADMAGQWRREIDLQERRVVEWFTPAKRAAFKAHAAICRQENDALAPYREARRVLNAKLAAWQDDQVRRRERIDGERRLDAEVRPYGGKPPISAVAADHAPRVEGVNFRENWRVEVIDKLAFVAAIASRPELVNLIDPNLAALGHLARAQKNALNLAGVRVWCERIVATSRRW